MRNLFDWLRWQIDAARAWCERVIYCHHNARVLADMEWRFGLTLYHATGGQMSKAYYDVADMKVWIDAYVEDCCADAVTEAEGEWCLEEPFRSGGGK